MPASHFGVLFILGIGAFGAIVGARLFQRYRIPQVVGYIAIGLLIGRSGLHLITRDAIIALQSFNLFALGLIGFLVGGELKGETFRLYKRQFLSILFGEGLGAFLLVGIGVSIFALSILPRASTALSLGIVFAAIASATDPASTINVLWEYRCRGIVSTTLIAIIALDDALAMTLYGIGTCVAEIATGTSSSLLPAMGKVGIELGGAIATGLCMGLLLNFILRWFDHKENTLVIALGSILLVIGITASTNMDTILATMTFGVTLANIAPRRTGGLFTLVRDFSVPIYVIFFVLVGARLSINAMPSWLWGIVIIYVVARSLGKIAGAAAGAWLSKAPPPVIKYAGMGLLSQGGVAVGLSIMASQHLGEIMLTPELSLGEAIIFGVTASTLIVQVAGPPMVKLASQLAGETNRNVTDEDIIALWTVRNAMDEEPLLITENESLGDIFQLFSEHENLSYPVVDHTGNIKGIITLERLKNVIAQRETWDWLVAGDIMIPVKERVYPHTPLGEAIRLMNQLKFDRLPVVEGPDDNHAMGMLDLRRVQRLISEEVFRRQQNL